MQRVQPPYLGSLRKALSEARLRPFARPGEDDELAVISRYTWNLALCRALYPSLHVVEVALRNRVYSGIATGLGACWLTSGLLQPKEAESVTKAIVRLEKDGKLADADHLVAELNFGFWTSLFLRRYEQILWPRYLRACFPETQAKQQVRSNLFGRLDRIRILRNRVFHHEPIWHWKDLREQHKAIWEMIGFLCPRLLELVSFIDDFPEVLDGGRGPFESLLREFMPASEGPG